ncbi:MAG: ATP-dependent DNA helicase RecG [Geminicoccaceae bacterium]
MSPAGKVTSEDGDADLAPVLAPVRSLNGVGPRSLSLLETLLGRREPRVLDLLCHLPNRIARSRLVQHAHEAADGDDVLIALEILQHEPAPNAKRPHRVRAYDGDGFVHLVFFRGRRAYLESALPLGARRWIAGRLSSFGVERQIAHPEIRGPVTSADAKEHVNLPVYPLVEGLHASLLGKIMRDALRRLPALPEWLDGDYLARHKLPGWQTALLLAHHPLDDAGLEPTAPARRRLAFDEALAFQLTLLLARARKTEAAGRSIRASGRLRQALLQRLPFTPTQAQTAALDDILSDMARQAPMLRLLQGDVGSGKTLVAAMAMLEAIEAGHQTALMAPTEILARQHLSGLAQWLLPLGIKPLLLIGGEKSRSRRDALAALAEDRAPLVIGTHALFQDEVCFADLGLVVIDEQHRFGVHQRLHLASKGAGVDVLVMTATPIPRSLVLTAYGDMSVTRLLEKPPGRQPVTTSLISADRLDELIQRLSAALAQGEQIFWVCPLVSESEKLDLAAAAARFDDLERHFPGQVGLIHGQMRSGDKAAAMRAFQTGRTRLLVATTVIEVGVDVPAANTMVIEHAERFGLAQLHQLRGRVGRGDQPAHCLLVYSQPLSASARGRLKAMRASDDGFYLAEEDLRLRGPGELLGVRQSGLPAFRFLDLHAHGDLLLAARDDARLILHRDPKLETARGRAIRHLLKLFGSAQRARLLGGG